MKQEGAHVQGFALLMPSLNPANMLLRYQVDDSRAYEADLKAEVEAILAACKTKNLPIPIHFESRDLNGRRLFGPVPEANAAWADMDPQERATLTRQQPRVTFLALDGSTVEAAIGGADSATRLGAPQVGSLSDDDGIRRAAALLPREGTFFAFMNFGAIFQQQADSMKQMDAMLAKESPQNLPPIPEAPDCPPMGLSLRFDLDHWDLSLAMPVETQLALGRTQKAMAEAQAARMKAFREQLKRREEDRKSKGLPGGTVGPPQGHDD